MQVSGLGQGSLQARCERCGARAEVPLVESAPAVGGGPLATDESVARCPKCRTSYGARPACPGCGLAVARMPSYSASRAAEVPPELAASWEALAAVWDDQARHDAFIRLVATHGAFAWAAGKYQDACRQRAGDRVAARQLERVRRTAEAAMLASAAVRAVERPPYRSATAVLIMLVVALGAGTLYTRFLRGARPAASAEPVRTAPAAPSLGAGGPRR